MKLKVYGWTTFHRKTGEQIRVVLAAKSWAEASRISGDSLSHMQTYGAITGNETEIKAATSKPGVVFFVPCRTQFHTTTEFKELK